MQTSRFTADGVADFTVRASGTSEQPSIEAHIHLKDLALDKERAGDFYVDAVTHGRQLDLNAHSDFDKADLTIQGNVGLEHDFPADLNLVFHHLDADSLLRIYLPGKITGHSLLEGTLHVRGPLRTPRDLKAVAELQSFSFEVAHQPIQSVGSHSLRGRKSSRCWSKTSTLQEAEPISPPMAGRIWLALKSSISVWTARST